MESAGHELGSDSGERETSEVMSFVTWLPGKARRQAWAQVFRGEGLPCGGCLGPLGHPRDQIESA